MIALRLFSGAEVAARLWGHKCIKVAEYETSALWKTRNNFFFTVPQLGRDKRCDELTFEKILEDIKRYGGS